MVRALLLMFLSLVYRRDPFLAHCYIQCTHPLLARLLDVIKCSITFMLIMALSYTAISRKVVRKNVHATIPKGNMGYVQYTVPDTVAVEPTFVSFL